VVITTAPFDARRLCACRQVIDSVDGRAEAAVAISAMRMQKVVLIINYITAGPRGKLQGVSD
jgi:hypothetical protein